MMRFISVPLLLAFLFASTHSIVDHGAGGHKSSVWLPHGVSFPVQTSRQHSLMHAAHHHDPVALHIHLADAHGANIPTHFTLASFPRSGSTFLPLLLALPSLILAVDD